MSIKGQKGFSLVELLITMVIFVFVIVAASNIFIGVLSQFKQQSKIAETNIEGVIGLQMLKADIEQAGYGLPYDINSATYAEASGADALTVGFNATAYNDSGAPGNPPRAVLSAADLTMTNRSDVLVVKATNIAINDTVQKWAFISNNGGANIITTWNNAAGNPIPEENLRSINPIDNVTVVGSLAGRSQKTLVTGGGAFFTQFSSVDTPAFAPPSNSYETYLIYGITPDGTTPIMPFNRADYYVRTPGTMPSQCAPGTGILYKGTINHTGGGGIHSELPLLDCVAAMKVLLARDANSDGVAETYSTSWPVGTVAADIRAQLKEIRIYILLHEGQRDPSYQSPATITITDPDAGNLLVYAVPDRSYRWKVYTMVITPYNLR